MHMGFFVVDVADYDQAIQKSRDSFQPRLALDFLRQLALEPAGSEHIDINFVKNKDIAMSYRKTIYEEFDETYDRPFGCVPACASPGSIQELAPAKKPSKAPLSGWEVFADTVGKVKNPSKLDKLKDYTKKISIFSNG